MGWGKTLNTVILQRKRKGCLSLEQPESSTPVPSTHMECEARVSELAGEVGTRRNEGLVCLWAVSRVTDQLLI